jgi:uncharacterized repeat protein (TIGR03803 family)
VLHNFNFNGVDGVNPQAGLIFDGSGNLYGTTHGGGPENNGAVFELTPAAGGGWTEKVLHRFNNNNTGRDGFYPEARVIFDASGNLYGTTSGGGAHTWGTVFELTPTAGGRWTEKVLHSFPANANDGVRPQAGLVFDSYGNLYGTTFIGGAYGFGMVFELTPTVGGSWTEKVVYNFTSLTDGTYPEAGLTFDASGNLYGTTSSGGTSSGCTFGCGTVFELIPTVRGTWTKNVLHTFNNNGTDGYYPQAGLLFDAAGNLYGTTEDGGALGVGTVFEITP